jgi:hypothetical protein
METGRTGRSYGTEFKRDAVKLVIDRGRTPGKFFRAGGQDPLKLK